MPPEEIAVRYLPDAQRFETDGSPAGYLEVMPSATVWTLSHTVVPKSREGGGVGSALVRAALAHVRAEGATVMPLCPFVVAYLQRHPDEADVVHPKFRYMLGRPDPA